MRKAPNQHVSDVRILVRDAMPTQAELAIECDEIGNETAASIERRKATKLRQNIARDELIGLWLASREDPSISLPDDAKLLIEQWQAQEDGRLRRKGGRRPDEHSDLKIAMAAYVAVSTARKARKARQEGEVDSAEWRAIKALEATAQLYGSSFEAVRRLYYNPEMQCLVQIELSRLRREEDAVRQGEQY